MSDDNKTAWRQSAAGNSCHVPDDLRWDEAMQKAFLECASYHLNGMTATVSGREITASGDPSRTLAGTPANAIEELVQSLARGMRDLEETELESHVGARAVVEPNVWQALCDKGAVRSLGSGNFAYSGVFFDAMNWLDNQTLEHALEMGAAEEAYPTTVPAADLVASGYLKSFPHHMIAAAPAAVDADAVAHVQSGAVLDSLITPAGSAALQAPARILSPTVCYHCFGSRRGSDVGHSRIVTAIGSCHRHEPHGVQTLERLNTFTMREIIHFGSKDSVAAGLDASYDWLLALLRRCDIPFRATTASDPFFGTSSDSKRAFQTAFALKREVRLPVFGTDRWISVASFNHHGDHMQRTFDLSRSGGEGPDAEKSLQTGCVGFGYERMLFCLLSYIGLDREVWPAGK